MCKKVLIILCLFAGHLYGQSASTSVWNVVQVNTNTGVIRPSASFNFGTNLLSGNGAGITNISVSGVAVSNAWSAGTPVLGSDNGSAFGWRAGNADYAAVANIASNVSDSVSNVFAKASTSITINGQSGTLATNNTWGAYFSATRTGTDIITASNTTPVTVTNCVFTYDANSGYKIDLLGPCQSVQTAVGYGFAIDVSSAVTLVQLSYQHTLANAGTQTGGGSIADNTFTAVSSGVPTANANIHVSGTGLIITGANTGTAQLMFRAEVNGVVKVKPNFQMLVTRIY